MGWRSCLVGLAFFVAQTTVSLPARAQEPAVEASGSGSEDESSPSGLASFGAQGTGGFHRVQSGFPLTGGTLILSVNATFFSTTDFIEPGDDNERQTQRVSLTYAPIELLEIFVGQCTITNTNPGPANAPYDPPASQTLGDPNFGMKFSGKLTDTLGIGGLVNVMFLTSARGTGLKLDAFILDIEAAASFMPISWLELGFNLGYRLDNSNKLFRRPIEAVQRFAGQISNSDLITVRVGALSHFAIAEVVGIGPFLELSAGFGTDVGSFSENPMLATLGTKLYPAKNRWLELTLGADVRLLGEPEVTGNLPGLPPWELFARLGVNLLPDFASDAVAAGPAVCQEVPEGEPSPCPQGQECFEGICTVVREVVKEIEKPVSQEALTFVLKGNVFDATSGEPISGAEVSLSGFDTSPLLVDRETGGYTSFPVPVGEGLLKVKVSAPGYRPSEQTITKNGQQTELVFKMQATGEAAFGEIRGSLKDARSGKPVKGKVIIPVLSEKLVTDEDGKFGGTVKEGRYQVLISGRGYQTQKKEIDIRLGETYILNVDMRPKRR